MNIDDRLRQAARAIDETMESVDFEARLKRLLSSQPPHKLAKPQLTPLPAKPVVHNEVPRNWSGESAKPTLELYRRRQNRRERALIRLEAFWRVGAVTATIVAMLGLGIPVLRGLFGGVRLVVEFPDRGMRLIESMDGAVELIQQIAVMRLAALPLLDTAIALPAVIATVLALVLLVYHEARMLVRLGVRIHLRLSPQGD
jgi:hypothetical protein